MGRHVAAEHAEAAHVVVAGVAVAYADQRVAVERVAAVAHDAAVPAYFSVEVAAGHVERVVPACFSVDAVAGHVVPVVAWRHYSAGDVLPVDFLLQEYLYVCWPGHLNDWHSPCLLQ